MRMDDKHLLVTPQSLIDQAQADYSIEAKAIQFGDQLIEYYQPSDPESILDDETLLSTHGELDWQPYWAQTWDASIGMCQYLADTRTPQNLAGLQVLDLGCGIGLTSAYLASQGAQLVCGDNAPPSLLFTEINTWPWHDACQIQFVDWHTTELDQSFDLIVGSDIVYDRKEVAPLDLFFRRHLRPEGHVLLSDPSRPMTREFLQMFKNLDWKMHQRPVEREETRNQTRVVEMALN